MVFPPVDAELVKKTRRGVEKLSENLYIIGNEPTLACYRIQEHVHKSGPMIIDKGTEMKKVRRNLQGCCYGVDYSIQEIKRMEGSVVHFQNMQDLLKNALFFKQQLDYEQDVRARVRAKQQQQQQQPQISHRRPENPESGTTGSGSNSVTTTY